MLQEHADEAFAEFSRTVGTYHLNAAGLKANKRLLTHVNRAVKSQDSGKAETSILDVREYLARLRNGEGRWQAARALGADPKEIKQKLQFDASFREDVILAEEEAAEQIEDRLWILANAGEKWAMQEWLQKRYKDRWGDEPVVVKHEGAVEHNLSAAPLIEQIMALQETLQKRAQLQAGRIIDAEVIED